ncbi:MAG: ATP-binding protein [Ignavibacteriaceae bacterium]|jgi:predicted AAA+ superfamily ATPase|nr:ATP-binding protein [Ignavibacteriaceae bacterium]
MTNYIKRTAEKTLLKYLSAFPVVGLTGPRQSGKSTLLKELLKDEYKYVTFDSPTTVAEFRDDPERFMRINGDKVIFDEAQKAPEIFTYVKIAVDNDREKYGKFILSGSSQFTLMKKITESLAGRIGLLTLLPMQFSEIPLNLHEESIFKGGYPELVKRDYNFRNEWYQAYINTYLEKDLRSISDIGNIRDFFRLIKLLAARCSQMINFSELASELGVVVNTVKHWLSVLEASYIIFFLPPFFDNLGKRIVKSPKLYFYDTGLVSFLTGIDTEGQFENSLLTGPLFENYIVSEVKKIIEHKKLFFNLYYYRTAAGVEIDLIVDKNQSQEWIEIKTSETFQTKFINSIERTKSPEEIGKLVYRGLTKAGADGIGILNYKDFLQEF